MSKVVHAWTLRSGALVELTPKAYESTPPVNTQPEYDIVIGFIQSNMRGVATDYSSDDQYPANVYMWNHASQTIVQAAEPQSTPETTTGMGASNTFLKDYAASSLASGRRLLMVNVARGGTGFTTPSTNSSGGSGLHWRYDLADDANNLALRSIHTIQTAVAVAGSGARIVACIANHGSTDGSNNTPKATFKAYLQAWILWMRTQLNIPNVPYIMMQMRPDLVANETRHRIIDEAQREVASDTQNFPNVGYAYSPVGSTYYRNDSVHFNAAGMREIGHALYNAYRAF